MSNSLRPHGLQYVRLSCPSLSPRVCSDSYPLSWWCHPTISSSVALFSCLQFFLASVFSNQSALCITWLKCWGFSFSISPSNEYSELTSWYPCNPRDSQESSLAPQFESINSSELSLLYGPAFTSIHDYWKNHSFDYTDLCWQSVSLLFNMLSRFVIAFLPSF